MKKVDLSITIILALFIAACLGSISYNNDTDTHPPARTGEYTLALVMKTLTNPFFIKMERGARQSKEDYGINRVVRTAAQETAVKQHISIIEDLIDVLIFNKDPLDTE